MTTLPTLATLAPDDAALWAARTSTTLASNAKLLTLRIPLTFGPDTLGCCARSNAVFSHCGLCAGHQTVLVPC
jgi:hypothetical protein